MSKAEKKETLPTINVGIVRPISVKEPYKQGHWNYVHRAIQEALSDGEDAKFTVKLVSENTKSDLIQSTIIGNLYHADVVICDLSSLNPNVFFELGIRMAYRKPCVLLLDDLTKAPFDVAPIRYIEYPSSFHRYELEEKQKEIRKTVIEVFQRYQQGEGVAYSPFFTEVNITESAALEQKDATLLEVLNKKLDVIINNQNPIDNEVNVPSNPRRMIHRINKRIEQVYEWALSNNRSRESFLDEARVTIMQRIDTRQPLFERNAIFDECWQYAVQLSINLPT